MFPLRIGRGGTSKSELNINVHRETSCSEMRVKEKIKTREERKRGKTEKDCEPLANRRKNGIWEICLDTQIIYRTMIE